MKERTMSSGEASQRAVLALSTATAVGALAARYLWRRSRFSFRGRVVLLTGGTRGLGLAVARQLVDEGAWVWLLARSRDELREALADLEARGGRVRLIRADVRDPHTAERVVDEIVREAGHIDVLINNAGVITVAPFEHTHLEDFAESLATHFWGPLRLIRATLPYLTCDGSGRIVNVSSIGGLIGVPHLSAYAAGKFALTGLSQALNAELKREGIRVTTVTPGLMRTGSYVNARVRGQHREEARWFSLSATNPLSSKSADRAATQILDATRRGRATCTPGWQARAAHVTSAAMPELAAMISAFAVEYVLPRPSAEPDANDARPASEIDQGWTRALLPKRTRKKFHQPPVVASSS